jgi:hypothetical protein
MPDLLPKRPPASSAATSQSTVKPLMGETRASARPGMNASSEEKDLSVEVKKAPSKIWTEYFGALFLFIIAIFILVAFFVLHPLIIQYKKITGTVAATATQLTDEQGYLDSLHRSIAAAQSIPPNTLADIDEALPREAGIPKLLTMMPLIAQQQHVSLNSISFAPSPGGGPQGSDTVDIDISFPTTGYTQTRQMLEALEYNLRLFDIDSITIAGGSSQDQTQDIRIRTYNLPPPANDR